MRRLYSAVLLKNYEVDWSVTTTSPKDRDRAIREFAVMEYRAEPDDHPGFDEPAVGAEPGDFIDSLGVLITLETNLTSTGVAAWYRRIQSLAAYLRR